ncbi:MAG: hypothetical protein OXC95_09040 [Dehalococcoidia bacterium]|nr:hypothetical protein [Dehalococcoidia bacterium]
MVSGAAPRRRTYSKPFLVTLNTDTPRIVVSHQSTEVNGTGAHAVTRRVVTIEGRRAAQHLPMTLDLLNKAGVDVGKLDVRRGGRSRLSEERGARLVLTLAAIAPVRKPSRTTLIRAGIAEMSDEEVCYWYARMSEAAGSPGPNNALKALRIMLAGE